MDFRNNLPTWISLLFFCFVMVVLLLSGLFTNYKKSLFFSLTSLGIWFVGLGIGYLAADFTANWIEGLLDPNFFPSEVTRDDILAIIRPYALVVIQWVFCLVCLIFQGLIWSLWVKKIVMKKRKKKSKKNWPMQTMTMFLVPTLALPWVVQISTITLGVTASNVNYEKKASELEKFYKNFVLNANKSFGSPTNEVGNDLDAAFGLSVVSTEYYDEKIISEWYADYFGSLFDAFDELSIGTITKSAKTMVAKISEWKEVNDIYVGYLNSVFSSESISKIFIRELEKRIKVIYPTMVRDKYNDIIKIMNCLVNGFSTLTESEHFVQEPFGDFSYEVSAKMFGSLEEILLKIIFNEEFDAKVENRIEKCEQFLNYFFRKNNKLKGDAIEVANLFNISEELPADTFGSGTKDDPYEIKKSYFNAGVARTVFCNQLVSLITPRSANQEVNWSFVLIAEEGKDFAENNWITTPTTDSYFGDILINYNNNPISVTPDGQCWGIISKASNGEIEATSEFFWRYIN